MLVAQNVLGSIVIGMMGGTIYGLLAMGLSLQYGVCRVLNITHGEFAMLAAVLTFTLSQLGINPLLAAVIIGPILFGLGFLLQSTLYRAVKARAPSQPAFEGNALLVAFGLMYIISNAAKLQWGSGLLSTLRWPEPVARIGFVPIQLNLVIVCAIAVALGIAVYLFLRRAKLGRAIRATAEDQPTAELMGVNTRTILAFCFGLGALLAAVAGTLISIRTQISTSLGFNNTVLALIIVTLGGLGSVPGSFIAGMIIGIISNLVISFWEPILAVPVYYGILMVLLLARPSGILGKK